MTLYHATLWHGGQYLTSACPARSMTEAITNAMSLEETLRLVAPQLRTGIITIEVNTTHHTEPRNA